MFSITAPLDKRELAKQSLNLQHNGWCQRNVKRSKNMVSFSSRDHDQNDLRNIQSEASPVSVETFAASYSTKKWRPPGFLLAPAIVCLRFAPVLRLAADAPHPDAANRMSISKAQQLNTFPV
jgi:hypothetical protein